MYCKECGKEINDDAKFCSVCGASLQTEEDTKEKISLITKKGVQTIKCFISKEPGSALDAAGKCESPIGAVFMLLCAILFGLVSCFNITQVINHTINSLLSNTTSVIGSLLGELLGELVTGNIVKTMEIPVLFKLFLPMMLFALIIAALIVVGIYVLLKIKKTINKSFTAILNYVGVSCLPVIASLIINFLFGFFLPQITIYVFAIGILVAMILLYEAIKRIFDIEGVAIFEFAFLMLAIILFMAIAIKVGLNAAEKAIVDSIMSGVKESVGTGISAGLDNIFG
ncbi:MAG: zinc ribbon domain-containing protein [Ruminococcaceae bacterium]|nr:zinc ribbon domain-containing protein [Oscillospiraceae bacterium]